MKKILFIGMIGLILISTQLSANVYSNTRYTDCSNVYSTLGETSTTASGMYKVGQEVDWAVSKYDNGIISNTDIEMLESSKPFFDILDQDPENDTGGKIGSAS